MDVLLKQNQNRLSIVLRVDKRSNGTELYIHTMTATQILIVYYREYKNVYGQFSVSCAEDVEKYVPSTAYMWSSMRDLNQIPSCHEWRHIRNYIRELAAESSLLAMSSLFDEKESVGQRLSKEDGLNASNFYDIVTAVSFRKHFNTSSSPLHSLVIAYLLPRPVVIGYLHPQPGVGPIYSLSYEFIHESLFPNLVFRL